MHRLQLAESLWAASWAAQTVSVFVRKHKIHQQLPTQTETRTGIKLIWLKPKIKCLNSCVLGQFHRRPGRKKKAAFNSQIDSGSMLPVMRSVSVNYDRQRSGCRATKLSVRREVWNQCCLSSFYTHRHTQVELRLLQSVCYFCLVILSIKK